ncbi:MAG: leucine-rich repeat domain-containing protein [Sphaerospermopsis sp. SIO1G2]|nr:leucine-rich repeat domain-containing protein [Sphaerospermopsis sp. SIO1G2]
MDDNGMSDYIADLLADALENGDTHLDLGGFDLTTVPANLFTLLQLTHLSLRDNQLAEIPAAIGQLTQLKQLSLADNQLTAVPAEIGQLTQLRSLNLKNNQLTELPLDLLDLTSLERLQLSGNPLNIPADLLAKYDRPPEILAYYQKHCVVIPPPPPRPLYKKVAEAFSTTQLTNLAADLCVPPEIAGQPAHTDLDPHHTLAQNLIQYHQQHGLAADFLELLQTLRPGRFS